MLVLPLVHLADAAIDGREVRLNASERRVYLADARRDEHLCGDANHRRHADDGAAYLRDQDNRFGGHAMINDCDSETAAVYVNTTVPSPVL